MKANSLRELFVEQLKDLYDAEHQLIKALPKIAKACSSEELGNAFEEHLAKTQRHAQRIEQVFEAMRGRLSSEPAQRQRPAKKTKRAPARFVPQN